MKYIFILTPVANSTLLQLKCILRALTRPPSRSAPSVHGAHGGRVCEKRCGRKERQSMFFRVAEALMCVQREEKKAFKWRMHALQWGQSAPLSQ